MFDGVPSLFAASSMILEWSFVLLGKGLYSFGGSFAILRVSFLILGGLWVLVESRGQGGAPPTPCMLSKNV